MAEQAIQQMDSANQARLKKMFIVTHALMKQRQSYNSFLWACSMEDRLDVDMGTSYRTDKKCREFCHFIAEVERLKLVELYQQTKFISLVVDGSTDSSVTEQEIIYIRMAISGKLNVRLLGISATEKANAPGILQGVMKSACEELEVPRVDVMKKLVGMGTDGAAVMQGRRAGLVALMKAEQPALVGIHCLAHRLELGLKDTLKQFKPIQEVDKLLLDIYLFYHFSPLNRSMLRKTFETLNFDTHLIPTRIGGTRWVGHLWTALDKVLRGYEAITTHMTQVNFFFIIGHRTVTVPTKATPELYGTTDSQYCKMQSLSSVVMVLV